MVSRYNFLIRSIRKDTHTDTHLNRSLCAFAGVSHLKVHSSVESTLDQQVKQVTTRENHVEEEEESNTTSALKKEGGN